MGIAAYNRGSRAISRYIDQQLREAKVAPAVLKEHWFSAKNRARLNLELFTAATEDNEERRRRGLPEYLPNPETVKYVQKEAR